MTKTIHRELRKQTVSQTVNGCGAQPFAPMLSHCMLKSAQHTCSLPRGRRIVGLASALSSRIVVAPARETTISAAPHDCAISSLLTNGPTVSYHFHNLQLRLSLER